MNPEGRYIGVPTVDDYEREVKISLGEHTDPKALSELREEYKQLLDGTHSLTEQFNRHPSHKEVAIKCIDEHLTKYDCITKLKEHYDLQ